MTTGDDDRAQEAFQEGNRLYEAGDFAGALAAYDLALELRDDHSVSHYNRGNTLSRLGRHEEALAAYDRSLKLRPDDPVTLTNRGVALSELGRYEEALAADDRALELRPDNPRFHYNRGVDLSSLGRNEDALAAFDRSLALGPDDPGTHYNRGVVLGRLGRNEEALAAYDRALALRADDSGTHNNRGNALGRLGRNEESLAAYDRSLKLRPDDPDTMNNRGVALAGLGRYRQAVRSYERAIRAYERSAAPDALPHANKGEALYRLDWFHKRHLQEAVTSFRRALDLDGESLQARNGLGVCLLALGHPADAASEFSRAVEQALDEADLRYNYAVACQRDGRADRAKSELQRVIDEHPTFEPARRALDKLSAPPAAPDMWQWWTGGSTGRGWLGFGLLAALAVLVGSPIVYLLLPSLDGPALPWQYYVAALAVVAGALVLPAVRQFRAFGVELEPQPPRPAEAQLEPLLR